MNSKVFFAIGLGVVCMVLHVRAQLPPPRLATGAKHLGLLSSSAGYKAQRRQIEQYSARYTRAALIEPRTIPVVFHIIYRDAQDSVDSQQIFSQLDALNRDFGWPLPPDTASAHGYSGRESCAYISFCLAQITPQADSTTGMEFKMCQRLWGADDSLKYVAAGGLPAWNPAQYLNIWVAPLADSVTGYAQMPGGPPETDGIVIDYRYLGTTGTAEAPYHQGKTLSRLVGHYLNLFDIWGLGSCGDDLVYDTPEHNAPNTGCPAYKHVSLCGSGAEEMTMNFMDNTCDSCKYMFTAGQVARMHAVLSEEGARNGLCHANFACLPPAPSSRPITAQAYPPTYDFQVYPNPADGYARIRVFLGEEPALLSISLFNALGQPVLIEDYAYPGAEDSHDIRLDKLPSGPYFLSLRGPVFSGSKKLYIRH